MSTNAILVTRLNPLYLRIVSSDNTAIGKIHKHFEVFNPKATFSPKYKMGLWNGKISFFNKATMTLTFGLWEELVTFCKSANITLSLSNFTFEDICNSKIKSTQIKQYSDMLMKNTGMTIREYQLHALHRTIMFESGIILAATGSGKSFIIYHNIRFNLMFQRSEKILLIVPSVSLVEQMYSDFKNDYGWDNIDDQAVRLHSSVPQSDKDMIDSNLDKPLLITTWQSLVNKRESFFSQFDSILIDEVHLASAKSIQDINKKTFQATKRLGFTGTMPDKDADHLIDFYTIVGSLGPIIYTITTKQLIDVGVLAEINIKNLIIRYPIEFADKNRSRSYAGEQSAIEKYEPRNSVIKTVIDSTDTNSNTLVLVKHIDHLKDILAVLEEEYGDTHTISHIYGTVKAKDRERIRQEMDNTKKIELIFGDKKFLFGVNDTIPLNDGTNKVAQTITVDDNIDDEFIANL